MDAREDATRREMHHRACSAARACAQYIAIELRHSESDDPTREILVAPCRALARWPYFVALFARADPVRIGACPASSSDEGDGTHDAAVYAASMPFAPSSVRALVEATDKGGGIESVLAESDGAADPVDAINCAIYLGACERDVHRLIAAVLDALLSPQPIEAASVSAFVLHLLAAPLRDPTKRNLLGRFYYLLSDEARAVVAEDHSDLVPQRYYGAYQHGVRAYCDAIVRPSIRPRLVGKSDVLLALEVSFMPQVLQGMDAIKVAVDVSSTTVSLWQCYAEFYRPLEPCRVRTDATVCSGGICYVGIGNSLDRDATGVFDSPLTACEIILHPLAMYANI